MAQGYRDRTYIRKDIILILSEYGELNQTKLLSYAGLNIAKHKEILDDMEHKELLERKEEPWGKKTIIKYKVSPKGHEFFKLILEPYEEMFPRSVGVE
ncbi:MAG TPA: winged helix-turn-helix domain-containing protein [Nitrosopumilaceae archaeon]|nr:winged helix-turn-helix domain-containing protein [Nitrosopumilaceae archaeon]